MPRPLRDQTEGSLQHITLRGNRGVSIFEDDDDRYSFLSVLADAGTVAAWQLLTFCLMGNHVHVLIRLGQNRMADGMHLLMSTHSHRYNAAHKTDDHLFGARYHTTVIKRQNHLLEVFRYIALNPWRAGMTRERDDWKWSAHRALAGLAHVPPYLDRDGALEYFGRDQQIYREFVAQGERVSRPPLDRLALGGEHAIRTAYFDHGYTQQEIADAFGLSQSTVGRRVRRRD